MQKPDRFAPSAECLDLLNGICPVSRETIDRLTIYHRLLDRWQQMTNLVAPSTLPMFWTRHVADSLQVMAIAPSVRQYADIGSGGGFPGMVLAIVLEHSKSGQDAAGVSLIESNTKKCAFLRHVARETGISVKVWPIRIESAEKQLRAAQVTTCRAVAPLPRLMEMIGPYLTGERRAILHKGREHARELEKCRGKWRFDLLVHRSKIDAESVLLEISNAERAEPA